MSAIRIAETDAEIAECFDVMRQLRPHLTAEEFANRSRRQRAEGYRVARLDEGGSVVAVAGFRVLHNLAEGRFLYVDDLVTSSAARSRGHGKRLLAWLHERARAEGCSAVDLDSGTQRKDAHRFYEREGMTRSSYHYRTMIER